jgi:dTDP-4-dehydrorhamnose reductase
MRVLLTGSNGTLGQDVLRVFSSAGHEVVALDRDRLDITDPEAVRRTIVDVKPDLIINTAAYNLVDKAEEPAVFPIAYAVNALGPKNLAEAARDAGVPFIHYSTDYVFAGTKPEGYREDDEPDPISRYGETKAAGEKFIREVDGQWYILRLSKIFGSPGISDMSKESFVQLILRLAAEKPELKIVDEEVGCPTYTKDIAEATLRLVADGQPSGVYHVVNDGPGVTWYQFAEEIFAIKNVKTPRLPVSAAAFPPRPAPRPKFAALLNTKLPKLRPRSDALKSFLSSQEDHLCNLRSNNPCS